MMPSAAAPTSAGQDRSPRRQAIVFFGVRGAAAAGVVVGVIVAVDATAGASAPAETVDGLDRCRPGVRVGEALAPARCHGQQRLPQPVDVVGAHEHGSRVVRDRLDEAAHGVEQPRAGP